jgi:hypothetical protein
MPAKRQLELLSNDARNKVERAMQACAKEGYAMWGFIFAERPATDRIESDGKDFVQLESFNNAEPIHSVPVFIVKTEQALGIMRSMIPAEYDIEADREATLRPFEKERVSKPN